MDLTLLKVSLVVILFEMTGALSHVLPIMVSVMVSKWTGDAFGSSNVPVGSSSLTLHCSSGKEGIYAAWIQLRVSSAPT